MFFEFPYFLCLFLVTIVLSIILFLVAFFSHNAAEDFEKLSVYECGFDPFEDTRSKFDVKYYLLAILYIVFDLELVFIVPWTVVGDRLSSFSFCIIFLFILILTFGFIYEWFKGALE